MIRVVGWLAVVAATAAGQAFTESGSITSRQTPDLGARIEAYETTNVFDLRTATRLKLGLTPDLEFEVESQSVWYRRVRFVGADGFGAREVLGGLADPHFQLKTSLLRHDGERDATRLAAFAELGVPVGRDSQRANGVLIPRQLQISSGGWTFGGGGAFTWIRDRHRFSTEARFRHYTRHDGFRLGETIHINTAYRWRATPDVIDVERRQLEVRPMVELLYEHRFESRAQRGLDDDGDRLWLAPGVQLFPFPNLQLELSVRLPVWQTMDGPDGNARWGALASVRVWF